MALCDSVVTRALPPRARFPLGFHTHTSTHAFKRPQHQYQGPEPLQKGWLEALAMHAQCLRLISPDELAYKSCARGCTCLTYRYGYRSHEIIEISPRAALGWIQR